MKVGILGATGLVGRTLITLLKDHPWFTLTELAASDKSVGMELEGLILKPCIPNLDCDLVFSALSSNVATKIEQDFIDNGYTVISNTKNYRDKVPLIIPEVNPQDLKGNHITNPNCSVIGLSLALKPLVDAFGISSVHVTTLQALSGAGYPGVSSLDILDNVIPYIPDEEEKIESEPKKIFSQNIQISASCTRVAVSSGHLASISIKLKKPATENDLINTWNAFTMRHELPSCPLNPIKYSNDPFYPQPKIHRDAQKGMQVTIGRLRPCSLLDWKFTILSHNLIRGAAGASLGNAELYYLLNRIQAPASS